MLTLLLEKGADINLKDCEGFDAKFHAEDFE